MLPVLLTLVAVLIAALVYLLWKIERIKLNALKELKQALKAANKQSRATIKGQLCEDWQQRAN
jgi:hypothetical protein